MRRPYTLAEAPDILSCHRRAGLVDGPAPHVDQTSGVSHATTSISCTGTRRYRRRGRSATATTSALSRDLDQNAPQPAMAIIIIRALRPHLGQTISGKP